MNAPLKHVRGIYFDLDDTLCAYWDACKVGLKRTFAALSPEGQSVEAMMVLWAEAFCDFRVEFRTSDWFPRYLKHGEVTRTELMRLMLLRAGVDDPHLAKRMGDMYAQERDRALKPFPGAHEVLGALSGRYPLGLITNGPADVQRQEMNTVGVAKYFQHVFVEGELGFGKPDPRVFELAAQAMNLPAHDLLFVGNSYRHDIQPAIAMGWNTVWIRRASDVPPSAGDHARDPESKPEGAPPPNAEIGELPELLPLLGF